MIHWQLFFWFHDIVFIITLVISVVAAMWSLRSQISLFSRVFSVLERPVTAIQEWWQNRRLGISSSSFSSSIINGVLFGNRRENNEEQGRVVHEGHDELHDLDELGADLENGERQGLQQYSNNAAQQVQAPPVVQVVHAAPKHSFALDENDNANDDDEHIIGDANSTRVELPPIDEANAIIAQHKQQQQQYDKDLADAISAEKNVHDQK